MTQLKDLPKNVWFKATIGGSTTPQVYSLSRQGQTGNTLAYINQNPQNQFPHITISGSATDRFRNFHVTDKNNVRAYYQVDFDPNGNPFIVPDRMRRNNPNVAKYRNMASSFLAQLHTKKPLTEKESETEKKPLIWQGLTLDEYILQLPDLVLDRNIPHFLKQPSLKKLVKCQYRGNLKEAITRSIAHLAKYALYTGSKVYPGLNRKLRVFETQDAYGTNYQIYTWPLSSKQSLILTLQQAEPMSAEVDFFEGGMSKETGLLEIEQILDDAAGRFTTSLNEAPAAIRNKGWQRGIYVIFRDGKRVDLGKSANLPKRLNDHLYSLKRKKLETENYKAIVFHYPNANDKTLLAREREYRRNFPNVFSHLNDTEMEDLTASYW